MLRSSAFAILLCLIPEIGGAALYSSGSHPGFSNRLIVTWKSSRAPARGLIPRLYGNTLAIQDASPRIQVISAQTADQAHAALKTYRGDPSVLSAEADSLVHLLLTPNDPFFPQQWYAKDSLQSNDLGASQAWDLAGTNGHRIVVAVFDTGIDPHHVDLSNRLWINLGEDRNGDGRFTTNDNDGIDNDGDGYVDDVVGWNFIKRTNTPWDDHFHGTHVSGLIAGGWGNAAGMAGLAPNARIMVLKVLDKDGYGSASDIILAIYYANMKKARLMNFSLGGSTYSTGMKYALEEAGAGGALVVCAAGNEGSSLDNAPLYPAAYPLPHLLAIGASTREGTLATFSCWSSNRVAFAAPGQTILSCLTTNAYGYLSGTSMAAPLVTGTAALLGGLNSNWAWSDLKPLLCDSVTPRSAMSRQVSNRGILHAGRACLLAIDGKPLFTRISASWEPSSGRILVEYSVTNRSGSSMEVALVAMETNTNRVSNQSGTGTNASNAAGDAWTTLTNRSRVPGSYTERFLWPQRVANLNLSIRLDLKDRNGFTASGLVSLSIPAMDAEGALRQVRVRNQPWLGEAPGMVFDRLPSGGTIRLMTLTGTPLRQLISDGSPLVWDMMDDAHRAVWPGVYLALVQYLDETETLRLLVARPGGTL